MVYEYHSKLNLLEFSGLPRIGLKKYTTKFWRPNGSQCDSSHLATIEAIYFFLREYHQHILKQEYSGEYDNLLMIFKFMYGIIRDYHGGGSNLKAYKNQSVT